MNKRTKIAAVLSAAALAGVGPGLTAPTSAQFDGSTDAASPTGSAPAGCGKWDNPGNPGFWDHQMWTNDGGCRGGRVQFRRANDVVRVCDTDKDGFHVWVWVGRNGNKRYRLTTKGKSAGECRRRNADSARRFDLPEGRWHFKICLRYGRTVIDWSCDPGGAWWRE